MYLILPLLTEFIGHGFMLPLDLPNHRIADHRHRHFMNPCELSPAAHFNLGTPRLRTSLALEPPPRRPRRPSERGRRADAGGRGDGFALLGNRTRGAPLSLRRDAARSRGREPSYA